LKPALVLALAFLVEVVALSEVICLSIVAWNLEPSKIQQLVMAINSANAVR
jgi:hypothetical protein